MKYAGQAEKSGRVEAAWKTKDSQSNRSRLSRPCSCCCKIRVTRCALRRQLQPLNPHLHSTQCSQVINIITSLSRAVPQVNLPPAKQPPPQLKRLIFKSIKSTAKSRVQVSGATPQQTPCMPTFVVEDQQNIPHPKHPNSTGNREKWGQTKSEARENTRWI